MLSHERSTESPPAVRRHGGMGTIQHHLHQKRPSRWLMPYVAGVDLAASVLLLATFGGLPPLLWPHLFVFVSIAVLTESWTVILRRQGEISLSFTVHFAAAVLFGPCFGALTAIGGSVVADGFLRRKGIMKTAFGAGQFALSAGIAGLAFETLRHSASVNLVANVLACVMAAVLYVILNSLLASGIFALLGRPLWHVLLQALREGGVFYVAMAPLGALMASAYDENPWAMLYFPLLIWVFYKGFRLYARLCTETDNALVVLANTIDKRDRYTFEHSVRVADYAAQIAARLDLPADEQELVVSAAQVHDLGKISIDNRILLKEGPITDEERAHIQTHAAAGAEIAGQFSMYQDGADIIRHHHERWDGSGYPDGIAGEDIPLGARIIAVADVYDAMTSDRPYRKALSHEVAVSELIRGCGSQFEARMVEAFLSRDPCGASTPVHAEEGLYVHA